MYPFYSYERPFDPQSLWNSRPTTFELSPNAIPSVMPNNWYPSVGIGQYSLAVRKAETTDLPMKVYGPSGPNSLWLPDAETTVDYIVVPHWPVGTVGATGADGHADVVDVRNNKVHSFWQLRNDVNDEVMRASSYAWTALDGRGFATPASYYQGSRATGAPASAGLIRKHEVEDGAAFYGHALAMSMDFSGLAKHFIYPATAQDSDAATFNFGTVPSGALMMIPSNFDLSKISNPLLVKVCRTLMTFGAYVVDRNEGTPFVIYVEEGSNFDIHPGGWNSQSGSDLRLMQGALRQVMNARDWIDGNSKSFVPVKNFNLLSLRGRWSPLSGGVAATFDLFEQSLTLPNKGVAHTQLNATARSVPSLAINPIVPGAKLAYSVKVQDFASLQLRLLAANNAILFDTPFLANDSMMITWPANVAKVNVYARSNSKGGGKIVRASLTLQ